MGWAKRLIEYSLVVLVAAIVSMVLIYLLFPNKGPCTNCVISMPQVRAECEKQFFSTGARARQLDAGAEDEFLVAYVDAPQDAGASSGGYSPPGGYSSAPSTPPVTVRGPGYVMVRAQPQFGFDYSGNQTSSYGSSSDPSATQAETSWDAVTVTVARYVNPLRNDAVCGQTALRFREGKFETYCEIPNRFTEADGGQMTYRIFVRNESSVPLEYCIVSNCDASAPYGQGSMCQLEQPQP
ncbi:MAG: hypothetical protein K8S25_16050 [Alphaproteobacteria bacterium]|nr:hypothetical protein [Alphaproteobacteria bacterium]